MKLPEKWCDYSTFGDIIPGTNIILTKTPLKEEYFAQNETAEKFTPEILKQKLEEKFNKRVGMVIDLTNTNKYYHALDICKIASDYYKLTVEGQEVPPEHYVQQFIRVIDTFNKFIKEGGDPDQFNTEDEAEVSKDQTKEEKPAEKAAESTDVAMEDAAEAPEPEPEKKVDDPADDVQIEPPVDPEVEKEKAAQLARQKQEERAKRETDRLFSRFYPRNMPDISACVCKTLTPAEADSYSNEMLSSNFIIVVHCTHGVNRAGYMIGRYLIDRFGIEPTDAIERIKESRGHPFDREKYTKVLMDDELRQMIRLQQHYTYLADRRSYFQYVPGMRFRNPRFATWKTNAKRKAEEAASEETQPDAKLVKVDTEMAETETAEETTA